MTESVRCLSGKSWGLKLSSRAPGEEQSVELALNPSTGEMETDLWGSMASQFDLLDQREAWP